MSKAGRHITGTTASLDPTPEAIDARRWGVDLLEEDPRSPRSGLRAGHQRALSRRGTAAAARAASRWRSSRGMAPSSRTESRHRRGTALRCDMATLVYRCPATGLNVQGWFADDVSANEDTYETVKCLACNQMHFVNRSTGRTLGNEGE
jgi:hypothetical protein